MPRLLSLNLNHRTRPAATALEMIDSIAELLPDVVIFNEYVDQGVARDAKALLTSAGFGHQAVSDSDEYKPRRWHNQILVASNVPIEARSVPTNGPDEMAATNTLTVRTHGIMITGLRVPAYTKAADWYTYWEWMNDNLVGDVAIGDFNADPSRPRKWDRVLETLVNRGGWSRAQIEGAWSYKGNNGSTSRVDHVLTRGSTRTIVARYIDAQFVPEHTDHAALLADIELA